MNSQENYKCPCCGGNLKTGINNDTLFCNYCGFVKRISDEKQEQETENKKVNKEESNDNELGKYDAIVIIASLVALVLMIFFITSKM